MSSYIPTSLIKFSFFQKNIPMRMCVQPFYNNIVINSIATFSIVIVLNFVRYVSSM